METNIIFTESVTPIVPKSSLAVILYRRNRYDLPGERSMGHFRLLVCPDDTQSNIYENMLSHFEILTWILVRVSNV